MKYLIGFAFGIITMIILSARSEEPILWIGCVKTDIGNTSKYAPYVIRAKDSTTANRVFKWVSNKLAIMNKGKNDPTNGFGEVWKLFPNNILDVSVIRKN